MDTMENYKSYLNKTHTFRTDNESFYSLKPKQKLRAKTIEHQKQEREIKTAIGQDRYKELNIIQ